MASKKKTAEPAGRSAKPARAKKAEVRNVDADGIEEVKSGLSFEEGIVLTTTLLLIGCVVLVSMALGRYPS